MRRSAIFRVEARLHITRSSIDIQLRTIAQMGMSDVDLNLKNIDKGDLASYKGRIELVDFKLGEFVKDSLLEIFLWLVRLKDRVFQSTRLV